MQELVGMVVIILSNINFSHYKYIESMIEAQNRQNVPFYKYLIYKQ